MKNKKNQWWEVTGLDLIFLIVIFAIFFFFTKDKTLSGYLKAAIYVIPIMLVYWIVGRIVQGRSDGPGGV